MSVHKFNTPGTLGLLSTTTFGLVQFLVLALYPAIAEKSGIHISTLILSFTLGSLLFIWSAPFWARKSDHHGRQKILRIGLFGLSLSFALLILITELKFISELGLVLLIVSRVIYGLTASAIVSVVQAWWRDQSGDITKNMISHSIGLNLGRFLAPLTILISGGELQFILRLLFIWLVVLTLATLLVSSSRVTSLENNESSLSWFSFPLQLAFGATLFVGLVHSNLAQVIKSALTLSTQQTSILCSQVLLMSSVTVLVFQVLIKKLGNFSARSLLWIGLMNWLLATYFFSSMNSETQLWPGIFFISTGLAFIVPGYLSLVKSGGQAAGQVSAIQTLGLTLGGIVGYAVLQNYLTFGLALLIICSTLIVITCKFPSHMEIAC